MAKPKIPNGWRRLKPGSTIKAGDKWWLTSRWIPTDRIGQTIFGGNEYIRIKRKSA